MGWFPSWFGNSRKPQALQPESVDWGFVADNTRVDSGPVSVRRWEAARVTEHNALQFCNVTGQTINEDLVTNLPSLIDRCTHEISTNPTLAGMVATHAVDICGPGGPEWQLVPRMPQLTGDAQEQFTAYCAAAEDLLGEWFENCDFNGELSGAEMLQLGVNEQWGKGNAFQQILTARPDGNNPVSVRLLSIDAARILKSTIWSSQDGKPVRLGIQRTDSGKRARYYVTEQNDLGAFSYSAKATEIEARDIIHHMRTDEPGQIAGVPWIAAGLGDVANIRQFSDSTMKAAQLAASLALVFQDKDKDSPVVKGGSVSTKMGATQIMHAPRGKEVIQVDPKHPASSHTEFCNENWRSVGRSVGMPLMIARLDSSEHSYASARMDRQLYFRSLEREQFAIEKRFRPVLMEVLREAELRKLIPPRPVAVRVCGIFQAPPHADPQKEAKARETDLRTMTRSLIDIWAEQGIRPAEAADKMRRAMETLNTVRPKLGDTYLQNLMTNAELPKSDATAEELIEMLEEQAKE